MYFSQVTETVILFMISAIFTYFVVAKIICSKAGKFAYPPGPWSWPVVGNLPSILPGGQPHRALALLAEKYGPIMGIHLGPGYRIVVLSSLDVVKQVLVKKADLTSDRRIPPLLGLAFTTQGSVIWENGQKWKTSRRISLTAFQQTLGTSSAFSNTVESSLRHLRSSLQRLTDQRCNPRSEITTAIAEVICSLCFGHCLDARTYPKIAEIMHAQHNLSKGLSGISLGHIIPHLYHTPLYSELRRDIERYKQFLKEVVEEHKVRNESRKEAGINKDDIESFTDVTDSYLHQAQNAVAEEDIWRVMFDLHGAGSETTSETLIWGILYLCLYPEVQRRVHLEIDENAQIDKHDEVITFDRRAYFPYTQATILELLRCACVAPLSLPRVASSDFTILGYSIRRGTEIWMNEWAINRDKNIWSDPDDFNPMRFLDDSGRVDPDLKESFVSFGKGRRMCLGRRVAEHLLFVFFVNIMRWFTFRFPEDYRTLPDVNKGNFGLVYSSPPYDVIVSPRDTKDKPDKSSESIFTP